MRKALFLCAASALLLTVAAHAQDAPSLGDVARQVRLEKQQKQVKQVSAKQLLSDQQSSETTHAASAKPVHVVSSEDAPERPMAKTSSEGSSKQDDRAEEVRSEILSQKNAIAALQQQIEELGNSIHYAGGNCVANCVQWNEHQKEKQDQVDSMKAQLDEQQKKLEAMQDTARKQGFGSSVYEP
jgi:hypothetical protein